MATERGARGAAATGTVFRWSLLGYIVVEYAGLLGTWPWRETLASVLGGVVLVAALVLLPPRARLLPLGLVAAGLAVTATARAPAGVLLACLREMSNVAALLALLPVLGRVFQVKPYGLALFGTGRPLSRSPVAFQQAVSLLAHAVGAVATFSALVVTYEVLRQAASDQRRLVRGCVAILRGYTASILWSPNATAFAIAAHYTGAPLARAVPGGLCLAAAAFVYQTVFEWWEERRLRVVGATAAVDGVAAAAAEGGVPPVRRRLVAEFLVIM
ncbi:MAG: hypothetical protein IRY95_04300, partial [Clostridia bacterium]|nr:hypothetical protein [Clostridia bacterium]